jgi:hypothetical protein
MSMGFARTIRVGLSLVARVRWMPAMEKWLAGLRWAPSKPGLDEIKMPPEAARRLVN